MASPKHLWSGDWEQDSDDAAASREQLAPEDTPQPAEPPAPARSRETPDWGFSALTRETPPRPARRPEPAALSAENQDERVTLAERLRRLGGPRGIRYRIAGLVVVVAAVIVGVVLATSGHGKHAQNVTKDLANTELGLVLQSVPNGVIVQAVRPGSPAALIGIGASSILETVDGTQATSPQQVNQLLAKVPQGHEITLALQQGNSAEEFQLPLSGNSPVP